MWVKPGYHPDRPTPPQEQGRRLATFPRGEGAELRVSLAEYQGRPYVALRVWDRDQAGAWWPCKGKGCSVRLSEAAALIGALQAALAGEAPAKGGAGGAAGETSYAAGQGGGAPPRDDAPKYVDKGRPIRPPWDPAKLAPSRPAGPGEFDEFEGGDGTDI